MLKYWLIFLLLLPQVLKSQCVSGISTFPYRESFENSSGGWWDYGTRSDWSWGIPSKPIIASAGDGQRCWITGGLTGAFYNLGEASYLESPCFDFTNLVHPRVAFKAFWQTEALYDGANFQYSLDGGISWNVLGTIDASGRCVSQNWYNTGTNLSTNPEFFWTGNTFGTVGACRGGGGSGTWKDAWHDVEQLAGEPEVKFRFYFKAGTTCNNFDGFAFDLFEIYEAPPLGIKFLCLPGNERKFEPADNCFASLLWNFGDPASGAANTSTQSSPTHNFSAPGTYTVTLRATTNVGYTRTGSIQVTVASLTTTVQQSNSCSGNATSNIAAVLSPPIPQALYTWSSNPVQHTPTATNLGPGNYTVTVSDSAGRCYASGTASIQAAPPALQSSANVLADGCANASGQVQYSLQGGVAPYTFLWSNGSTQQQLIGVRSGWYSVLATDANGCTRRDSFYVPQTAGLQVNLGPDTTLCSGESLVLNPGIYQSYNWSTGSTLPSITVNAAGVYAVVVSDANGCTGVDSITIRNNCAGLIFPNAFTPNGDGVNDFFGPVGTSFFGISQYNFQVYDRYGQLVFNSTNPLQKWNGLRKGLPLPGVYVWYAKYKFQGQVLQRKGSVLLLK